MGRFANMTYTTSRFVDKRHISTLKEYHEAGNKGLVVNRAGEQIDKGRIAYLVNKDLDEMGMHPYIEIIDLQIVRRGDGSIGVDLMNGTVLLPCDTLVVWR